MRSHGRFPRFVCLDKRHYKRIVSRVRVCVVDVVASFEDRAYVVLTLGILAKHHVKHVLEHIKFEEGYGRR